jgi:exopolysaccharide biosynthesis protein
MITMPLLSRLARAAGPLALLTFCATQVTAHPSAVSFRRVRRAGVRASVITVNLNDTNCKVSVALSQRGVGSRESFRSLLRRVRPAAAVTGTYFGLRDSQPVGDIVIGGRLVNTGFVGTALAITGENEARFIETRRGQERDWSDYETVLCGGPRLVTKGRARVIPRAEGFSDRSLFRRRPRMAVGLTRRNRLVLVSVTRPIYLRQLARLMRSLGCRDAIALDGGSSSAMFYRGRFATRPRRSLTNLLVVYDSSAGYRKALGRLVPAVHIAARPVPAHRWAVAGSRVTLGAAATALSTPRAAERSDTTAGTSSGAASDANAEEAD